MHQEIPGVLDVIIVAQLHQNMGFVPNVLDSSLCKAGMQD